MKIRNSLNDWHFNVGLAIPFFYFILSPKNRLAFDKYPSNLTDSLSAKLFILLAIFFIILFIINSLPEKSKYFFTEGNNGKMSIILFNVFYFSFIIFPILLDHYFKFEIFKKLNNFFRVSYIYPIFADLETILSGINCKSVREIGDLITCQRNGQNMWNYPTVLLNLRHIIHPSSRFLLGLAFVFIFMITANYLLINNLWRADSLTFLILISPPFLLAINRGNFDLIIAAFLLTAAVLIRRNGVSFILALLIICISVWLKFYTLSIFVVLPFFFNKAKKYIIIVVGLSLFISVIDDLRSLSRFLSTDSSGSTGLPVLLSKLSGSLNATFKTNWITVLILCISILLIYFSINKAIPGMYLHTYKSPLFIFPGFVFISTWLTTSSYYYRLILLSLLVIFIVKNGKTKLELKVAVLGGIANYLSMQTFGILQNILILPIIVFWSAVILKLIQNRWKHSVEKV